MKIQLAGTVVLGLTAWAATLVVAEAEPADAASRRVAGLTCVGYAGHHDGAVWYQNEAEYDPDTTEVECPVQSDSTLSHSTVVTLNVYGSEATGRSNWSRACVRDNDSLDDAACGPTKNWGSGRSFAFRSVRIGPRTQQGTAAGAQQLL